MRSAAVAVLFGALATALTPVSSDAQRRGDTSNDVKMLDSIRADGSIVRVPIPKYNAMAELFAGEDLAVAAYRSTGNLKGAAANIRGPVPYNQGGGPAPAHRIPGYVFFEMGLTLTAPPHEWRKIRQVFPPAVGMVGSPGYTAAWQLITAPPYRTTIDAADGQFGKTFAGVTVVFDGSCRDDPNFFQEGASIMAMLDCPETWGSEGFKAQLRVPDSVYLKRFEANPNEFNWDDWKIPESELDQTAYLGTQTFYSYMSDYNREQKLRFGRIVPGGAGTPSEQGYPLGLEMRVDGWQFASPAVRNSQFYQLTIVNKSAELYGTGIDYDSLYIGLNPGFLFGGQHLQGAYFDFPRGSMHVTRQGSSGKCSSTYPRRYPGATAGCQSSGGITTAIGIYTITWLKSPLGDLKNKLFSNPESPFYAPGNPLAGDTITFNRAAPSAFGRATQQRSTRAAFGTFSNTALNALDGRTPAEVGLSNYLFFFTPEFFDGVLPDASAATFNRFVPGEQINPKTNLPFGKWDYNHDGIQDEITVPGCGTQGCHELWSDTNAGGWRQQWGNVFNSIAAGPYALASGDTTRVLWAFTWSPDTIEHITRIDNLINAYYTNYEGPGAIAFPPFNPQTSYSLSAAELIDSLNGSGATSSVGARVVIRIPQINPVDEYFTGQIQQIRLDSINDVGRTRAILALNPGLIDALMARAQDNLSAVYVFKSCDAGTTWTTSTGVGSTCVRSDTRGVDANTISFAWRPAWRIDYTKGIPSSGTITDNLMPGREYMYSFVTRTRGFKDIKVFDSTATGLRVTDVQDLFGIAADTINSAMATNGGTVVNIYAPISNAAGRSFARVDTASIGSVNTQDVQFTNLGANISGSSRLIYANRLIVRKTIDTLTNATTTTISAQYVLPAASMSPSGTVETDFVARTQTFTANANIPVRAGTGILAGTPRGISGTSRVLVDTVNAVANSMGYLWINHEDQPIFATDNQYAGNFEIDQQTSPLYPGYNVRSRDSATASTGFRQELLPATGTVRDRRFVTRAPGDTLQANARQFSLFVQPISASVKKSHGGAYELSWLTDPWGPGAPFRLDPIDGLQARVTASLQSAAAKATEFTVTDAKYEAMVGATAARPLVRVRVPFTMTYKDAETGQVVPVKFAMLQRTIFPFNTRILGTGTDTARVDVLEDMWMPGDTLWAIHTFRRDSTVLDGSQRVAIVAPETVNGVAGYRPIQSEVDSVGLNKLVISCQPTAVSVGNRQTGSTFELGTCNPMVIDTRGATPNGGWLPVEAGWKEYFELTRTFDARSEMLLKATAFTTGNAITKAALSRVNVVPNPYIVRSDMDAVSGGRTPRARVWFTGLPDQGILRIYSVSGQFLQELTWNPADLTYTGNITTSGDLEYDLRTREGTDLSSGLYLYVLTATGPNGNGLVHRGQFAIIR